MSELTFKTVSEELILERLRFENPWWTSNQIDQDYEEMNRRLYFNQFYDLVRDTSIHRAVVLLGQRRVGKTVLMHHTISKLIRDGVSPRKIALVNIENPVFHGISLEQLFNYSRKALAINESEKWFVFFDEIQYLPEWEIHLKIIADSYRSCKFVASGSAAAALKLKSRESGAGRFTDFILTPLTFHEYVHLKNLDHLFYATTENVGGGLTNFCNTTHIRELNNEFLEYINFGGYPEVIFSEKIKANPGRYIRRDIIDKVLLRDLPSLYGIENVQELNRFFAMLAYNSGAEISYQSLCTNSGINKKTLQNYLIYLESAFLIKTINRIDDKAQHFKRADYFKVYLTNPSMRSALFAPMQATDDAMGRMVETTVFSQWFNDEWKIPVYAHWTKGRFQGEVDMIGLNEINQKPEWAVEIKWSNKYVSNPGNLTSLLTFCNANNLNHAVVTTIDTFTTLQYNNLNLHFIPVALYSYCIGANLINKNLL